MICIAGVVLALNRTNTNLTLIASQVLGTLIAIPDHHKGLESTPVELQKTSISDAGGQDEGKVCFKG